MKKGFVLWKYGIFIRRFKSELKAALIICGLDAHGLSKNCKCVKPVDKKG